jgi:hypothetical protein
MCVQTMTLSSVRGWPVDQSVESIWPTVWYFSGGPSPVTQGEVFLKRIAAPDCPIDPLPTFRDVANIVENFSHLGVMGQQGGIGRVGHAGGGQSSPHRFEGGARGRGQPTA